MNKPTMKREVAIKSDAGNVLYVYATPDAASELADFGNLEPAYMTDLYRLEIDARFGAAEVVTYIKQKWG